METVNVDESHGLVPTVTVAAGHGPAHKRTNDRLDAAVRSSQKLREELQARVIARDAETAAAYARLARFDQIKNAAYEDITAYLDEANAHTRRSAVARSVVLSSTGDSGTVKA